MRYIAKSEILITSATDKTLRIWRLDKARELLMYPWFVPLQIIKDFTSINPTSIDNNVWVTCLDMQEGEKFKLFAGDSEGSMLTFKIADGQEYSNIFELEGKKSSIHRIGIIQTLLVPQENFVFTISFDQHLKAFDTTFSNEFFTLKNPNKVVYTSIFWDDQVLYIADEMGYVGVLNVYMDKPFIWKRLVNEPIKKIEVVSEPKHLIVFTEYEIRAYKIRKGKKSHDMSGHTGPILKIITLEPERLGIKNVQDEPKILTCSLDNTIKFWDAKDMSIILSLDSPEKSELSCMTYLMNCGLVATGHEDGEIRLWNLEINFQTLK
jgi:WD40 repeat protein